MTKDEALIVALETLKQIQEGCNNVIADKLHSDAVDLAKLVRKDCNKAIDAIRKSLAKPEHDPDDLTIAYMSGFHTGKNKDAPQREWVGLTDEDTSAAWDAMKTYDDFDTYAKAIEAKLKEKNGG